MKPTRAALRVSPRAYLSIALGALFGTLACAGNQALDKRIQERWQWDGGAEASRIVARVAGKKGPPRLSAAVGVTGFGLRGMALTQGKTWDFEAAVDVLPSIVGDVVLFTAEGTLYALDVRSGRELFHTGVSARRLEGAGFDGEYFLLLLVDKDDARKDELCIMTREGKEIRSFSVTTHLGTPAAIGGVALVPYGGQYVAGFEIGTGTWLGRLLYRDALHTVTADERGVLLWGHGVTLLDEALTSNPESRALLLPLDDFPGEPTWPVDGSKARPARAHPISVLADPEPNAGNLAFAQDRYLTTYYQIMMAKAVGSSDLLWVNHAPHAVSGSALSATHALLCLEDGSLVRMDLDSGASRALGSLEARLRACAVTVADQELPALPRPPLRQQIVETIFETGPDMAKVQMLLLDELATMKSPDTTEALLHIAQDPVVSSELARYAGSLLADQTTGGQEMIRALNEYSDAREDRLQRASLKAPPPEPAESSPTLPSQDDAASDEHGSGGYPPSTAEAWAEQSEPTRDTAKPAPSASLTQDDSFDAQSRVRALRPPPVAPIAVALTKMKTEGAAAALVRYLDDPSLTPHQMKAVMQAVFSLGGPAQTEQVHRFVLNYKNTGGEPEVIDALVRGVEFLLVHLDTNARQKVKDEIDESLTYPELQTRAHAIAIERVVETAAPGAQADQPNAATTEGEPAEIQRSKQRQPGSSADSPKVNDAPSGASDKPELEKVP